MATGEPIRIPAGGRTVDLPDPATHGRLVHQQVDRYLQDRGSALWEEWASRSPIVGHIHEVGRAMQPYIGTPIRGALVDAVMLDDAMAPRESNRCPVCASGHVAAQMHVVPAGPGWPPGSFKVQKNRFGGRQAGKTRLQFLSDTHYGDNHWGTNPTGHTSCAGHDCIICQHATPKEPVPVSKFDILEGT